MNQDLKIGINFVEKYVFNLTTKSGYPMSILTQINEIASKTVKHI